MSDPSNDPNREREPDAPRNDADQREAGKRDAERGDPDRYGVDGDGGGRSTRGTTRSDPVTDDERDHEMAATADRSGTDTGTLKWVSGIVSLIGLWIAVSPFVYETETTALWNNLVVGGAIFLLAGYGFYRMQKGYRPDVGSTSLAALLGLWAIAAPFLLPYLSQALVWSTVASGVVVAVLSGYNAYESRRTETARTAGARV